MTMNIKWPCMNFFSHIHIIHVALKISQWFFPQDFSIFSLASAQSALLTHDSSSWLIHAQRYIIEDAAKQNKKKERKKEKGHKSHDRICSQILPIFWYLSVFIRQQYLGGEPNMVSNSRVPDCNWCSIVWVVKLWKFEESHTVEAGVRREQRFTLK